MRALISVHDKTGLGDFAGGLHELGFELVASGGTATFLEGEGLPVTGVEELTEIPELLGGRVKTLHPRIHAGVLARQGFGDDLAQLAEHEIEPFDLVCVNLYPFEEVAARGGADEDEVVEMIDIGGPALLRGAAKNHSSVTAVCRPEDYEVVLGELRERGGEISLDTRRRLAGTAFATTAAYEAAIAAWFQRDEPFPDAVTLALEKVAVLPYGENPHQEAAFYRLRAERAHLLSGVRQLQGKELSFNNLGDLSAARGLLAELQEPACVIVKHANPCGVGVAAAVGEAYAKALAADPVSAYGGVVALNRPVSAALGEALARQFVEVLWAPAYDEAALESLMRRPSTRVLQGGGGDPNEGRDLRHVPGGLLVQAPDRAEVDRRQLDVACGELGEATWDDLLFAWRVVKHVASNAVVVAKEGQTLGIGAGQMSRVDAVRIALDKARELGHDLRGAVLASDAFFPFADGPQLALDAGIGALIQPGGSKRDAEVVEAVVQAGAAMVLTHRRHFRH